MFHFIRFHHWPKWSKWSKYGHDFNKRYCEVCNWMEVK